ncbi:hypothetical protein PR048_027192 [Dryococelus australis]|uniref:Uncharacterized protein n=1 Tax=Dryococelus australis TaxID=614101 RepID=A0ABQ9GER0_9NEOP|nr:hypothetical protein PR048_027192 [Dryococelus australis]
MANMSAEPSTTIRAMPLTRENWRDSCLTDFFLPARSSSESASVLYDVSSDSNLPEVSHEFKQPVVLHFHRDGKSGVASSRPGASDAADLQFACRTGNLSTSRSPLSTATTNNKYNGKMDNASAYRDRGPWFAPTLRQVLRVLEPIFPTSRDAEGWFVDGLGLSARRHPSGSVKRLPRLASRPEQTSFQSSSSPISCRRGLTVLPGLTSGLLMTSDEVAWVDGGSPTLVERPGSWQEYSVRRIRALASVPGADRGSTQAPFDRLRSSQTLRLGSSAPRREDIWAALNNAVLRAYDGDATWARSSAGMQGRVKRENSEKTKTPPTNGIVRHEFPHAKTRGGGGRVRLGGRLACLKIIVTFQPEKRRRRYKGYTCTRYKCAIAATRRTLYILRVVPRDTTKIEIISNRGLLVRRQELSGIRQTYLVFHWLLNVKCRVGAIVSCLSGLCDSGISAGAAVAERLARSPRTMANRSTNLVFKSRPNLITRRESAMRLFPSDERYFYASLYSSEDVDDDANRVRFPAEPIPGFSHETIVSNDAAGRRVFSGISRFLRLCIPALLNSHLASPSLALEVKSRPNLFTHSRGTCVRSIKRNWRVIRTRWTDGRCSAAQIQPKYSWGRGGAAVRTLTSHQGEPCSIPGGLSSGFPQVGIVPLDAADQRVFSGTSRSPLHLHSGAAPRELASPSLALKTSELRAGESSSLHNTQSLFWLGDSKRRVVKNPPSLPHRSLSTTITRPSKCHDLKKKAAFKAEMRRSNKGDAASHINCSIASKPTRSVLVALRVPTDLICTAQDHDDGNTARLARRSDETLDVRVRVARIAPSLLDLGHEKHKMKS